MGVILTLVLLALLAGAVYGLYRVYGPVAEKVVADVKKDVGIDGQG